jgi:hypothetical protein
METHRDPARIRTAGGAYTNDPFHVSVVERLMPMFGDCAALDYETGVR